MDYKKLSENEEEHSEQHSSSQAEEYAKRATEMAVDTAVKISSINEDVEKTAREAMGRMIDKEIKTRQQMQDVETQGAKERQLDTLNTLEALVNIEDKGDEFLKAKDEEMEAYNKESEEQLQRLKQENLRRKQELADAFETAVSGMKEASVANMEEIAKQRRVQKQRSEAAVEAIRREEEEERELILRRKEESLRRMRERYEEERKKKDRSPGSSPKKGRIIIWILTGLGSIATLLLILKLTGVI